MDLLKKVVIGLTNDLGDELSAPLDVSSLIPEQSSNVTLKSKEVDSESNNTEKIHISPLPQTSSQVVQVSPLPLSLTLSDYKDAYSNANPNGDVFAAKRFQQLVDPAPELHHEVITSPSSIERVYGQILEGASYPVNNNFLTSMMSTAKYNYETSAQSEFAGHGKWRIVEAIPTDWYLDDRSGYKKLKIDLDKDGETKIDVSLLNGYSKPTTLTLGDEQVSLSKITFFTHCILEYKLVRFIRPWMNFTLFETNDWWLAGQQIGYCSSGQKDNNIGVLPLVTTGMILIRSAKFEGEWDPADKQKVEDCLKTDKEIYIGPYRLSSDADTVTTVSVAAWISELVPLSPKSNGKPCKSYISFKNKASFKAVCVVKWNKNGEQLKTRSAITTGNTDKTEIPQDAEDVIVVIKAVDGSQKNRVFRKKFSSLPNKNYIITGTFESSYVDEY